MLATNTHLGSEVFSPTPTLGGWNPPTLEGNDNHVEIFGSTGSCRAVLLPAEGIA